MIFLIACEQDIILDIPEAEKKIVVNAVISPGDSLKINLSKSLYILDSDNDKPTFLANATANLYENSSFIQTLFYLNNGNYVSSHQVKEGNIYRLEVSVPDFNMVSAETRIPNKIKILKLDTATVSGSNEYDKNLQFKLRFNDPPAEENYYMITVYQSFNNSGTYDFSRIGSSSQDEAIGLIRTFDQRLIFTDELINGKNTEIVFKTQNFFHGDIVKVELSHITRDYFLYLKSLDLQYKTKNNPFAENVKVYNNIENGFGILGAFNPYSDTLTIQ